VSIGFLFSAMAARSDKAPARWRRPFLTWLDGVEPGWAVPLLLAGFIAIWMAFLQIAYLSGDLHPDVLETWSLGRSWEWGNPKHPPLVGWAVYLWTSVFPLADWSFQLLAMINSALALWFVDLISRRFVRGDKRIVVLLLAMLLPVYQFHAQRFNANTVLLAIWPLATYCFLRSFETRRLPWAMAAGATAALALLGKYYSVFLVGGFVLAAILHPQRRAYFSSLAPWIATAAGLAVLAPHLYWLVTTGALPFQYALKARGGVAFGRSLIEAGAFLLGIAAAMALPTLIWAAIAESRLRQFLADFRALDSGLLLLFFIGVATVVLPMIVTISLRTGLPSLWAWQGLFLFVVLMVCGAGFPVERFYSVNLLAIVLGIAVIAVVVVAPIHAIYRNTHPFKEGRNFYRSSSAELTRRWHQLSNRPLPLVSGSDALAFAAAFYSPDHPEYRHVWYPRDMWAPTPLAVTLNRGWGAMCFSDEEDCIAWLGMAAPPSRSVRSEFTVQSTLMGVPGATRQVTALIVPPASEEDRSVSRPQQR
jgi:4-amino-4-deoxy-L-arabinose transferase-like glycosyltransferase